MYLPTKIPLIKLLVDLLSLGVVHFFTSWFYGLKDHWPDSITHTHSDLLQSNLGNHCWSSIGLFMWTGCFKTSKTCSLIVYSDWIHLCKFIYVVSKFCCLFFEMLLVCWQTLDYGLLWFIKLKTIATVLYLLHICN